MLVAAAAASVPAAAAAYSISVQAVALLPASRRGALRVVDIVTGARAIVATLVPVPLNAPAAVPSVVVLVPLPLTVPESAGACTGGLRRTGFAAGEPATVTTPASAAAAAAVG